MSTKSLVAINEDGAVIAEKERLTEGVLGSSIGLPALGYLSFVILIMLTFLNGADEGNFKYILLHLTSLIGFSFLLFAGRSTQKEINGSGRVVVSDLLTIGAIAALVISALLGVFALWRDFVSDNDVQLKFWGFANFFIVVLSLVSAIMLLIRLRAYKTTYTNATKSECRRRGVPIDTPLDTDLEGAAMWEGEWTSDS